MRVAVMVERIGPYHAARLRAASAKLGAGDVVAIEIAAQSREYEWDEVDGSGFVRRTLVTDRDYKDIPRSELSRLARAALDRESPDAVAINGWGAPEARAAIAWCRSRSRVAIVMSDSQEMDASRLWPKERVKSMLLSECDAALVAGERHANYLVHLGFDRDRIVLGYDVVDNEHFAAGAESARVRGEDLRRELRLPDAYVLCAARFVTKKNLDGLLRAYASYRRGRSGAVWDLVVLGDGPLRDSLHRLRASLGLHDSVHFPGFKQYAELPPYYALARAFVLPSTTEQWGLVVNEAMASGLPVLVSKACGASELVVEGENGYTFDARHDDEIARAMELLTRQQARLSEMGTAARRAVERVSPVTFSEALARAVQLGGAFRRIRARRLLPNPSLWF